MDPKQFAHRLILLGGLVFLSFCVFAYALFDAQLIHGEEYRLQSLRTDTRVESIEASRGVFTDRNGKVIVSNRAVYTLYFDSSLVAKEDMNADLLRVIDLLSEQELPCPIELPVSAASPRVFEGSEAQYADLAGLLISLKWMSKDDIAADGTPARLSASELYTRLSEQYALPQGLPAETHYKLLSLRYALAVAALDGYSTYTFARDVDVRLISLVKDGGFNGVRVGTSPVRSYETSAAAHILGTVGDIQRDDWPFYKEKGYALNDVVGRSGVELAFEQYLHGTDGKRVITLNDAGKVTNELYSVEPKPGKTVALTVDIDFQEQVEASLAKTVSAMTTADGLRRGAAVAAIEVGTGDVLALASYPSFNLETFSADFAALNSDSLSPMVNRATHGTYAPGSIIKPLTAIAALESGVTTTAETLFDGGIWYYPGYAASYTYCWNRSGHGSLNVTGAVANSCNYFFAEMGYRLGMDRLRSYYSAFGLGESTGIEIGDKAGLLPSQNEGENLAPWAAYGQANQLYTPLQMASYIATLSGGGERYAPHLLKSIREADYSALYEVYDADPVETIAISDKNLSATLQGMRDLVTGGYLKPYFDQCIVDAAAKTGTAQTSDTKNDNGVFVCFAPYEDPQIAVAIVIEKGGSGSALASTAVEILNAYFSSAESSENTRGENTLLM